MKALLIDVDFLTGERPAEVLEGGKIKANLFAGAGWQNLDTGKEIRGLLDGVDTPYVGVTGITILVDEAAIRASLLAECPDKIVHTVSNQGIMDASIPSVSPAIVWGNLAQTATKEEELSFLYDAGVRGIDRKTITPQDPLDFLT